MHLLVNLCIFVRTAFYVSRFPHCRFTPIFAFSPHSWIMHSPPPSPLFTSFPCHYFALSTFVSPFLSCKLSLARISRLETCSTQPTSGHSVPVPEIPTCSHLVTWSTSSTHHLISLTIYRYISSPGPISRFCQSRFVLYQSQIAISSPLAQDPSVFHLNPRRTSDFKRGDVAGVRFCYCFLTVLLLYCTVLYCTVPYCSVVYCSWPVMFTCSVLVVLSLCYAPCPVSLVQCCTFRAHRIRVFTSPLYQLMRSSPAGQGNKCDLSLRRFLCSLLQNYTTRFSPRNMEPPD